MDNIRVQQFVARLLTLDQGNLRPFRLLAIFPRFAFRKASFLLLKGFKL